MYKVNYNHVQKHHWMMSVIVMQTSAMVIPAKCMIIPLTHELW